MNANKRRLLLHRGESLIASLGISAAAILMVTIAAQAWWGGRSQRLAVEASRRENLRGL